ncbi:MAG: succinate dehydrogenase, hydrophobic membrane anchor protein [Gammaproteobacteria bacterium]|jgi:succinate dehydrogenase / fumarate reductase membrane anchor subunit|nr:succinate dehydrogenase, hydrophobic membrane anchor protein [Gammaproteobacteria bacterium]NCF83068.1 succinate dehydrogenase, hydrophobic membrane anchor protein [Pseudomonadota bacterium]
MKFRTPLARVRGLGSARAGTHHWWMQRLTAIALVPLSIWFVASLISVVSADHATVIAWLHSPLVAILCCALIVATFYHGQLGVQVVLEDYVHSEWLKLTSIVLMQLLSLLLAAICLFAVLSIAFRS